MEKTKQGYSLGSNIRYSLRTHWEEKKSTLIFCIVGIIMGAALPFIEMLLPKLVIDELVAGAAPSHLISVVGRITVLLIVLNYTKSYTDVIINDSVGTIASYDFSIKAMFKQVTMDYELMEDPSVKLLEDKAIRAGQSNHTPALNMPRTLAGLAVNLLGFLLYGGVIVTIHPVILLLLVVSSAINWFCLWQVRSYEQRTKEERSILYKKLWYVQSSSKAPAAAKDIRLYSMAEWMKELFVLLLKKSEEAEGRVAARHLAAQLTDSVLILLRDGASYAFLIYLFLQGRISLGDFVFVFAAIGAFARWVSGILQQASELVRASTEMSDIRAYLDAADRSNRGTGVNLPSGSQLPPGISVHNVSYTYPKSDTEILKDINIEIKPGERIAIVGENGAGKTTLVKLICGLYRPQSGSILLGGAEAGDYNRDDYFTLLSTVFQDIHLLTTDIAGNISQASPEMTDWNRVRDCLKLSGLYERVQTLPDKEHTMLVRQLYDEAVELSGGEKQKLALARALYKDAPVIILDEPTAALDPIAESEVYEKYAELTKGKTSIYISHRLASTRFCDRIFLIDNHAIAESGTHDELMRLGGKYAGMFEIQSQYYKEDREVQPDGQEE